MESVPQPDINRVLAEITGELVGNFNMPTLLNTVVDTAMRTLNAEVCSIFLEDKQREPGVLKMMAGSGFAKPLVRKSKYKIGEGFTGCVALSGRKFNIRSREELENLEVDGVRVWRGKFDKEQWPSSQSEFKNCIALPLRIKDQTLGVIKVENKLESRGPYFTDEDEKYFETLANVVALAIENARLHEQTETQLKTIAAKAAHRINNQITNYDGIELELLQQVNSAVPDRMKLSEVTTRIKDTTKSLKRMVDEFKSYGQPLKIYPSPASLNKIIQDEVWLARPKDVKVETDLDPTLPTMNLDAGRWAEAMKELIQNSLKALSKGQKGRKTPAITVTSRLGRDQSKAYVEVTDSGPGFPDGFPAFEPFHSTDPNHTGLGLATVKELVEAHGGQIEALTAPSGGACIRISLPVRRSE